MKRHRKNPGIGDYLSAAKTAVAKHGSRIASEIAAETHAIATRAKEEAAKAEKSRVLTSPEAALEVLAKSLGYTLVKTNPRKRNPRNKRSASTFALARRLAGVPRVRKTTRKRAAKGKVTRRSILRVYLGQRVKAPGGRLGSIASVGRYASLVHFDDGELLDVDNGLLIKINPRKRNPKKSRAKKSPLSKLRRRESRALTSSLFRLGGTRRVSALRALRRNSGVETDEERAARHADTKAYRDEQDRQEREADAMRAQILQWVKKGPKRKPDRHDSAGMFRLNRATGRAKKGRA